MVAQYLQLYTWFIGYFLNVLQRLNFKLRFIQFCGRCCCCRCDFWFSVGFSLLNQRSGWQSLFSFVILYYVSLSLFPQIVLRTVNEWYRNWRFMVKWCKSISLQFYHMNVQAWAHCARSIFQQRRERERDGLLIFVRNAISSNAIERPLPTFNQHKNWTKTQSTIKVASTNCQSADNNRVAENAIALVDYAALTEVLRRRHRIPHKTTEKKEERNTTNNNIAHLFLCSLFRLSTHITLCIKIFIYNIDRVYVRCPRRCTWKCSRSIYRIIEFL